MHAIDLQRDVWIDSNAHVQTVPIKDSTSFVNTPDMHRLLDLVELMLEQQQPVMVIGKRGVGKTTLGAAVLQRMTSKNRCSMRMHYSHYSNRIRMQKTFENQLVKRKTMCFGPPIGKEMLCYIDDINAPMTDLYGCQPLVELNR